MRNRTLLNTVLALAQHFALCIFLNKIKIKKKIKTSSFHTHLKPVEQPDFIIFTLSHLANPPWMFPKIQKQISIPTTMHLFAFQCNGGNQHIITFIQPWHKPFAWNSYTFNHSLALGGKRQTMEKWLSTIYTHAKEHQFFLCKNTHTVITFYKKKIKKYHNLRLKTEHQFPQGHIICSRVEPLPQEKASPHPTQSHRSWEHPNPFTAGYS